MVESFFTKRRRPFFVLFIVCFLVFLAVLFMAVYFGLSSSNSETGNQGGADSTAMSITREHYGTTDDGQDVYRYTLKNRNNVDVKVMNYGGIITDVITPDRDGKLGDITLGFDNFDDYKSNPLYFGGIIGRYANRIANAQFTLDDVTYNLTANNGPNALHGGVKGFDQRLWGSRVDDNRLVLTYTSADGEEGYPGELHATVTFRLSDENELIIDFRATTTKPTVINLTSHPYFNLAGQAAGTLDDHVVQFGAENYTPVNNVSIPTGVASVARTVFDLTSETRLGSRIHNVPGGGGFDHNFVLGKPGWKKHVARIVHPTSGRSLDMFSTQPGVQFYTAFYIDGARGKGGITYRKFGGFALEGQHYPDSPNQPSFPSTVLRPGEVYTQTTSYQFGVVS